ncbi:MAG: diaminopimelate decarboxylase [Ruminococcaceae bacterium]|nr:diaminopimelate decarboxylase [Oscillospiraceae bacterium]
MLNNRFGVNEKGNLTLGGVDTVELANTYGTPLYVMDENDIRNNCREFKSAFDKYYGGNARVYFASKAFSCKEMYRIVESEMLCTDVVSGGELYTALSVGFPAEKIGFHGNNKTPEELALALDSNVGRIIVDNIYELHNLNAMAKDKNKVQKILLRIKPGIDCHTHDYVKTGQIDCKFGFALENGEAVKAVEEVLKMENVELVGIHCHIGSQIFETQPFVDAADIMVALAKNIKDTFGITLSEINFGGGYGVKYLETDKPVSKDESIRLLCEAVKTACETYEFPLPALSIEPGRSIVGDANLTLYKIGVVKNIENVRTYVSIDGGMGDNPRYALYNAEYEVVVANKADKPRDFVATIAGKCCESGDLIQEHTKIQTPEVGDTLAVLTTGAYNYSMASNYNRIPRPAAVMVKDGEARLIIKRENYEDLILKDI